MNKTEKDYTALYGENATEVCLHLQAERGYDLCGGVHYLHRSYVYADGRPVEADVLIVPADAPARAAVWGMPQGQSAVVPEQVKMMENLGKNVVAAVNADFFHFFNNGDKTTYGAQIIDGTVYKEPNKKERTGDHWFGVTSSGEYVISDLESYEKQYRGKLFQAVGGGDILFQNNEINAGGDPAPHPRTAVGITEDKALVIITVDGRMETSVGVNLTALVQIFFDLDCTYTSILNLDGGGSTIMMGKTENGTMEVLNVPCTGVNDLRPVADILTLVLPE